MNFLIVLGQCSLLKKINLYSYLTTYTRIQLKDLNSENETTKIQKENREHEHNFL